MYSGPVVDIIRRVGPPPSRPETTSDTGSTHTDHTGSSGPYPLGSYPPKPYVRYFWPQDTGPSSVPSFQDGPTSGSRDTHHTFHDTGTQPAAPSHRAPSTSSTSTPPDRQASSEPLPYLISSTPPDRQASSEPLPYLTSSTPPDRQASSEPLPYLTSSTPFSEQPQRGTHSSPTPRLSPIDNEQPRGSPVIEPTSTHSGSGLCGLNSKCLVTRQDGRFSSDHNSSSSKRTFEAFEERANAELVERALGDHDLDK
jgi:hypothetical protein